MLELIARSDRQFLALVSGHPVSRGGLPGKMDVGRFFAQGQCFVVGSFLVGFSSGVVESVLELFVFVFEILIFFFECEDELVSEPVDFVKVLDLPIELLEDTFFLLQLSLIVLFALPLLLDLLHQRSHLALLVLALP